MKYFVASFNRASDGAISKLVTRMRKDDIYTSNVNEADYVLAVGDRSETYDFVLKQFRENKPIIHLWAGEISQGTHDEVYRHSMTLMSMMQLCTNLEAKIRVIKLLDSIERKPNVHIIGNVMLDNLEVDESLVPTYAYELVLYNPTTTSSITDVKNDLIDIKTRLSNNYFWIEPNGDKYSEIIKPHVTHKTLSRPKFLGLLKNCHKFITNSSCQYYEAPFVMTDGEIIHIGERNKERESKHADMSIPNATDNIIKVLKSVK